MSETESFESVARSYDNCTWIGKDRVKAAIDRLKAAHDREMEELRKTYDLALAQARDPQRLQGTKPDTFDGAIEALREFRWQHATNDEDAIPYINAVKEMHDREMRDTAQQEYHRGFEDGKHSMDAEHRAVAMRLRALPLNDNSHENLSNIAKAIWYADWCWGWTQGACMMLRDELVRLMGGVSDDTCGAGCGCAAVDSDGDCGLQREEVTDERFADDCGADTGCGDGGGDLHLAGVTYDVLWNERQKAVRELRNVQMNTGNAVKKLAVALGVKWNPDNAPKSIALLQSRLIHLLGGDSPSGIDVLRAMDAESDADGTYPNGVPTSSITDELREWASDRHCKGMSHTDVLNIELIADRIDAQFDRICQQQEAVLQSTIDEVVDDRDHWKHVAETNANALLRMGGENASLKADCEKLEKLRDCWCQHATELMNHADAMERERDNILDLLDDARDEYKLLDQMSAETSANFHAMRDMVCGLEAERDELQAKLDEYDSTHVELPRDANGKVFNIGCTVKPVKRDTKLAYTVSYMDLAKDGWRIGIRLDQYRLKYKPQTFEVCDAKPDPIEETIEKLTLGEITQTEAIEHIKSLGQE